MARFKAGDKVRLNYRKSKEDYYGKDGRLATAYEYQGAGKWEVELEDGRIRTWFTNDMDNITGLVSSEKLREAILKLTDLSDEVNDVATDLDELTS